MTAKRTLDGSSDGAAEAVASEVPGFSGPSLIRSVSGWLGGNRLGLVVMALIVGAGAGLGAAVFRELIYAFTWLATGYTQFGQQGHAPSLHLPALGIFFVLVVPVVGGLLYGPVIQRFAREARGHGRAGGDARGRRERRADPPPGHDRQGARLGDLHRHGWVGGTRGPDRPDRIGAGVDPRPARADVGEPVADHRRVRCRGRDRRDVQRADHGAVLRLRDRPARVLARRAVRDQPRGRHRRCHQPRVLRLGAVLHPGTPRPRSGQRRQLPARGGARGRCGSDRSRLQDVPVPARGRRRRGVEGPPGMGAARGRRRRARRSCCSRCRRCTASATR